MPIYEYKCPNGHVTEVMHSTTRSRLVAINCPENHCGQRAERQISVTNWNINHAGPKESGISRAIKRVKDAERQGKLD